MAPDDDDDSEDLYDDEFDFVDDDDDDDDAATSMMRMMRRGRCSDDSIRDLESPSNVADSKLDDSKLDARADAAPSARRTRLPATSTAEKSARRPATSRPSIDARFGDGRPDARSR